jgi:nitrite reductase/ring-hydroxylating ferredoxin subunit
VSGRVTIEAPELGVGELRACEVAGRSLVICRAEDSWYALEDRCPHAAVPLSGGRLRGHLLECPFHGGLVDVRDGRAAGLPIRRPATSFPVRARAGGLEIDLGAPARARGGQA